FIYGGGNCVNFGNLALALLRAAGIPAREVIGPMIHEWTESCVHRWTEVFYPDKGWIQYETSYWMPNEGSLPWTFLIPRRIKTFSGEEPGITTGYAVEEHSTSTVIKSSPSAIQTSSVSIDTAGFISCLLTISKDPDYQSDIVLLSTFTNSNAWKMTLSQDSIYFDPDGLWGDTRDIVVTIEAPQNITSTDTATITVKATSQTRGITEQVIYRINSALSRIHDPSVNTPNSCFTLFQNYPNPFNPSTVIKYRLKKPAHVCLKIYNFLGQDIDTLINEFQSTGEYSIIWQPKGLPNGLYFYRLEAGNLMETKKLIVYK
ncbi:MAG: transglutaminase domain-containing protein, partial [bacterium]